MKLHQNEATRDDNLWWKERQTAGQADRYMQCRIPASLPRPTNVMMENKFETVLISCHKIFVIWPWRTAFQVSVKCTSSSKWKWQSTVSLLIVLYLDLFTLVCKTLYTCQIQFKREIYLLGWWWGVDYSRYVHTRRHSNTDASGTRPAHCSGSYMGVLYIRSSVPTCGCRPHYHLPSVSIADGSRYGELKIKVGYRASQNAALQLSTGRSSASVTFDIWPWISIGIILRPYYISLQSMNTICWTVGLVWHIQLLWPWPFIYHLDLQ